MAKKFKLPLVGLGTCYYETLDRDDPLYLAGVTNCVVGALGRGHPEWMVRGNLTQIPEEWKRPCAWFRQTAEMCCFTGEALTMDLSPREFYLAQQLVDGSSYKEIAAKLGVSSGRVNDLVRTIYFLDFWDMGLPLF